MNIWQTHYANLFSGNKTPSDKDTNSNTDLNNKTQHDKYPFLPIPSQKDQLPPTLNFRSITPLPPKYDQSSSTLNWTSIPPPKHDQCPSTSKLWPPNRFADHTKFIHCSSSPNHHISWHTLLNNHSNNGTLEQNPTTSKDWPPTQIKIK
ncbi:unnamed protein product [Gordionus sp. m RMFG-2023]